eukprot:CAMPEP_0179205096 /NCGR_PEP_ID=MMETSP0796-20121207/102246_1 /TAXON_ID=73915 /ORGANISM="Pyrodinium bahamense, Strain pbaha01" /LENGTH=416 /DNA_ID=CAMNT_0020909981 /DNA_START=93 /DNA_END=1342 /DNA_ORIENTATION=-
MSGSLAGVWQGLVALEEREPLHAGHAAARSSYSRCHEDTPGRIPAARAEAQGQEAGEGQQSRPRWAAPPPPTAATRRQAPVGQAAELLAEMLRSVAASWAAQVAKGAAPQPLPLWPLRDLPFVAVMLAATFVLFRAAAGLMPATPEPLVLGPGLLVTWEPDCAVVFRRRGVLTPPPRSVATPESLAHSPRGLPVLVALLAVECWGGRGGPDGNLHHSRLCTTVAIVAATPGLLLGRPGLLPPAEVVPAIVRQRRGLRDKLVFYAHGADAGLTLECPALAAGDLEIENAIHALPALGDTEDVPRPKQVASPGAVDFRRGARVDGVGHRRLVLPHLRNHHGAALVLVAAAPDPLLYGEDPKSLMLQSKGSVVVLDVVDVVSVEVSPAGASVLESLPGIGVVLATCTTAGPSVVVDARA